MFEKGQKHDSVGKNNIKSISRILQGINFPIKRPSIFQDFSETPSWMIFLGIWAHIGTKMLLLGSLLAPSRGQNGSPNRPFDTNNQETKFSAEFRGPGRVQDRFQSTTWSLF